MKTDLEKSVEKDPNLFQRTVLKSQSIWLSEYGLLIGFIAIICILFFTWLGFEVSHIFGKVNDTFTNVET